MNNPKQLRHQRLLSLLVCISFFATASTSLFGQQGIQQAYPTYQQQYPQYSPVTPFPAAQPQYQGQIQNGPIIYGQPIPTQGGQIIDGQFVQPGVITTPPGTQQAKPDAGNPVKVKQNDEARRLEEIKRLVAENKRLEGLAGDGWKQKQEVQRLENALNKATLELSEMQKSAAAKPDEMNSAATALNRKIKQQKKEIGKLNTNYRNAVQRNEALTSQIKTLTDESSNLKSQLSNRNEGQAATGMELQQLQSNLTTTSTALDEIKQKNEAMTTEYYRVKDLYESANTDNLKLNERIGELSSENQRYVSQLSEYSNAKEANAITQIARVEDAQKPTATSGFGADQGLAISDLKSKNQQLLGLNEEANEQNEFLLRRISELEGSVNELTINSDDREPVTTLIASNFDAGLSSNSEPADSSSGKYSVMKWLLPFLAIGLSVGLYVFLTEELGGASQGRVTGGDTRDDHKKKRQS